MQEAKDTLNRINQVLSGNPTVQEIKSYKATAENIQSQLNQARNQLIVDKAPLENAKSQLLQSVNQQTDTEGMTQISKDNFNQKLQEARNELQTIERTLNGNPTVQQINESSSHAISVKDALNEARKNLKPDSQPLETAKNELNENINQNTDTEGMTTQSIANFNEKLNQAKENLKK